MDKNVTYVVIGLVGTIAVQQAVIGYQAHFIERQSKRTKKMANLNNYLVDIVSRNDTPLDRFDSIAIQDIIG